MKFEIFEHNFKACANDMKDYYLDNLKFEDNYIKVDDLSRSGVLLTPIIETTPDFTKLVASWNAITLSGSIEVLVSIRVDGEFTKFLSYGKWSLYKDNYYYNHEVTNARIDVDEVIATGITSSDAFVVKVILENDAKLSLFHVALEMKDYKYKVKKSKNFPQELDYEVPKLSQNIVPEIGNQICSPTTITMLLKRKGLNFGKYDKYEQRYIASLVKDPGHNMPTYGNWVYNVAVCGALGINSYVARVYSFDELKLYLIKYGPVGASIRGDVGLYKTGGHLLVVRGYKEKDGKVYVICNDPNVDERFGEDLFVNYEYPLDVFLNVFRGIIYVLE